MNKSKPRFGDISEHHFVADDDETTSSWPVYTKSAEIRIESELLESFTRRGRRRIRDLQLHCQVSAKVDKHRGSLIVSAESDEAIENVRRYLSFLTGPVREVSTAVWAELMRTRILEDPSQSAVARLQEASGCRVHIERTSQEVRIFGPKEGTHIVDKMLEEMDNDCTEIMISIDPNVILDPERLKVIAHERGITFRTSSAQISVLGRKDFVEAAAADVERYASELGGHCINTTEVIRNKVSSVDSLAASSQNQQTQQRSKFSSYSEETKQTSSAVKGTAAPSCPSCRRCRDCHHCGQHIWRSEELAQQLQGTPNLNSGNFAGSDPSFFQYQTPLNDTAFQPFPGMMMGMTHGMPGYVMYLPAEMLSQYTVLQGMPRFVTQNGPPLRM